MHTVKKVSYLFRRVVKLLECISVLTYVLLSGVPMVPVGWQEMQCPKTYVKEMRKVAKVSPETTSNEKKDENEPMKQT